MCNNRSPPLRRTDLRRTENFSNSTAFSAAELVAAGVSCKAYPRGRPSRWPFGPLLYLLALVSATVPAVSQSGTQTQFSTVFVILKVGTISLQVPKR
jgi:hypothetical protein